MAKKASYRRADSVRDAMDRVLAAEREAQAEIELARDRARQRLGEARDEVRVIEERARRRRGRVHAACERRLVAHTQRLRREAGLLGADEASPARETALVEAACRRLAETLTSGS